VPPFEPAQVQSHGPFPVTLEALPVLQRFAVAGALSKSSPFAEPQTPFTGCGSKLAEQLAFVPPFNPWQVQDQGPEPESADVVPALQSRFDAGAVG